METLVGKVLAERYAIEAEIGRGARGIVYKARQPAPEPVVAIKVLFDDMIHDDHAFERFSWEMHSATLLSHPHIINVFDFGLTDDGSAYLAMECLEGENMQDILDRERKLAMKRALRIFVQIADALAHAHAQGIMHRDIKPENVILLKGAGNTDFVKIVDFGIAKSFNVLPGADLAATDQIIGSPAYMSPEACMGQRHIDARSDVYSFGCLMYRALTGVLPIDGATPEEVLSRQMSVDPPTLAQACPGALIPANVQEVVMKCLKKFPEARYQTMLQLRSDLNLLLR